ncbi:MAG: hypothetical protein COA79_11550 [Planctomycetota bacterium]|nr:MAG: hypothetical protein COA79_11550 [Planctomycetota bacterium]
MDELFDEATKFIEAGKLDEAIVIYEHILNRLPSYHEARHDLAQLLVENDKKDEAINILDEGLKIKKDETSFWFLKGLTYLKMRQFGDALKSFRSVEKYDGLSNALVLNMGISHRELGSVSAGLELLEKWEENCKDEPQLYCLMAEMHIEVHELDKAREIIGKGQKINPEDLNLKYILGIVYSRDQKWMEAIPIFKTILDKMPENLSIIHELGWAYIQVNYLEEGIPLLTKCYNANPVKLSVIMDLAIAYSQKPDFVKAMEFAKKAENLEPFDENVKKLIEEIKAARDNMGL